MKHWLQLSIITIIVHLNSCFYLGIQKEKMLEYNLKQIPLQKVTSGYTYQIKNVELDIDSNSLWLQINKIPYKTHYTKESYTYNKSPENYLKAIVYHTFILTILGSGWWISQMNNDKSTQLEGHVILGSLFSLYGLIATTDLVKGFQEVQPKKGSRVILQNTNYPQHLSPLKKYNFTLKNQQEKFSCNQTGICILPIEHIKKVNCSQCKQSWIAIQIEQEVLRIYLSKFQQAQIHITQEKLKDSKQNIQ